MNLPTRPTKIEDVPFRRQDRRTLNARYRRIMDRKLILCIAGSGLILLGLGAGLLVVHSMYKEECTYIRPFIVIGPVLIGGSFMTLLFSVEICIRLYHNTKRVKDPDMDNVINPHEVKHWMDPEIIPFGWGLFTNDEEVVVIEGEECEMPLCVSELISSRDILNTSSINSIVVNSRTNSTNEMENLLNSSPCLMTNSATGMETLLNTSSSHQLINSMVATSRTNSTNGMDNPLNSSSSQINSKVATSRTNSANEMDNPLNSSTHLINSKVATSRTNSTNEMENLLNASSHQLINSSSNQLIKSSSSNSINLPLGPRGSWAPVDETSAI